jgi:hypothetical protein
MARCWICGGNYVTDYCTACGPPEAWGPTAAELKAEADKRDPELFGLDLVAQTFREERRKAVCRHGVPYDAICERCELGMLRDAIDDMVDADEYRRRWREP